MTRRPILFRALALALVVCGAAASARAEERPSFPGPFHNIWVIDFEGPIAGMMHTYVKRRVEAAQADGADCIILRIDSPGGTIEHSMRIGDLMLALPKSIHTIAWIPRQAMSGAAMVSINCREIILSPRGLIGDSQPITMNPDGTPNPVGEKAESPLRSWMRAAAERNHYPRLLVAAMVSERMAVLRVRSKTDGTTLYLRTADFRDATPDAELGRGYRKSDLEQVGQEIVRAGELLTMTSREAATLGFMPRFEDTPPPNDETALLGLLKAPDAIVTLTEMSFSEQASRWLLGLAGILSALVTLAILVTVWQGPGIITVIGGIALLVVIFISATANHLHGFPIFLMLVGVALLVAEVFLLPGFTIPGILGVASLAFGLLLLATGLAPSEVGDMDKNVLVTYGLQFVFTALAGFGAVFLMSRLVPRFGPGRKMVLAAPEGAAAVESTVDLRRALPPVGSAGTARSPLRPAGSAAFADLVLDVVTTGDFIDAGTTVRITAIEGTRVTVEAVAS